MNSAPGAWRCADVFGARVEWAGALYGRPGIPQEMDLRCSDDPRRSVALIHRGGESVMAGALNRKEASNKDAVPRARTVDNRLSTHDKPLNFTLEEFFILGVLRDRELYGLQIVNALTAYSEFGISLGMGVIYPTLKTLVKEGALHSHQANSGPLRIYYSLTDVGRERFKDIAYLLAHLGKIAQLLAAGVRSPV